MDESRARALLRAERAEVATLLRDTEDAVKVEEQAPDIATDYGDESLPLTEGANDEAVAEQRVKPGNLIVLSGFGAGLTWGTAVMRW